MSERPAPLVLSFHHPLFGDVDMVLGGLDVAVCWPAPDDAGEAK